MNTEPHTSIAKRKGRRQLMAAAALAVTAFAAPAQAQDAGGVIALFAIHDLHRRAARCYEMRVRLETARKEATLVRTWGALERVVIKAERALLQEVFEWHSITSFADSR